jgi:hypothetical protein
MITRTCYLSCMCLTATHVMLAGGVWSQAHEQSKEPMIQLPSREQLTQLTQTNTPQLNNFNLYLLDKFSDQKMTISSLHDNLTMLHKHYIDNYGKELSQPEKNSLVYMLLIQEPKLLKNVYPKEHAD